MENQKEIITNLKKYIKNLDEESFFELYDEIDDPYELEDCMITELFKHYPEILCGELEYTTEECDLEEFKKQKEEIIKKLNSFFEGLIERGFTFDDNILSKRYDEPINFYKLYEAIGLDQQNSYGNTILHMQVRGLHTEGVKFLLEREADPNVFNVYNQNCFEILFLEDFIAYGTDKAYEKKLEIGKMLIENEVEFNRIIDEKDIVERTLYHTLMINNGQRNWSIDNLKILKELLNLNKNKLNSAIDKLIVFLTENKSIYPNQTLFKLDLLNINKMRSEII